MQEGQVPQEEGLPLEERISRAIRALHSAFEDCLRPVAYRDFVSVMEWGDMTERWIPFTREEVELWAEMDLYADDLDVMSTMARRYFVPAILAWSLSHPGSWSGFEFGALIASLESMWVEEETYKYSRATFLTEEQVAAVTGWCDLMLGSAMKLYGEDEDVDGLIAYEKETMIQNRILQLKECLPKATQLTDFDRRPIEEESHAKPKPVEDRPSRRKGWKRFKEKEGKRPRE